MTDHKGRVLSFLPGVPTAQRRIASRLVILGIVGLIALILSAIATRW